MWLRKRKATAVTAEPRPAAAQPPAEPEEDPQARHDRERREQAFASHAALVERIMRDGHDGAGFPEGPGMTREQGFDRLFSSWRRS
jgi:hypothetical protein